MGHSGSGHSRHTTWSSGEALLGGDNLIEVNNLAADPLINPHKLLMVQHGRARWAGPSTAGTLRHRTLSLQMGWHRYRQVGSDETPVRVLDEEVSTDQRAGITAIGSTAKGKFASRNRSRRGLFPGENHSHQGGKTMINKLLSH